jgi:microsomal dipeptidase-like Zn-dependent dipeptidase
MVGLNFATVFLRDDGRQSPAMGWDPVLRHLDHLLDKLGEDHLSASGRISTAPHCPKESAMSPACRACATRWRRMATARR